MPYVTSNPPALMSSGPLTNDFGLRIWAYSSTDASATVRVTGYITNGGALGMVVGDIVMMRDTTNNILSTLRVVSVSSTYPGAVDLSDAVVVGSATNSD